LTIQLTLEVSKSQGIMAQVIILMRKFGYKVIHQSMQPSPTSKNKLLNFNAEGSASTQDLPRSLLGIDGVVSILKLDRGLKADNVTVSNDGASYKEECKQIIEGILGATVAETVDDMSEEECVALCRAKVKGLVGEEAAKAFDRFN